MKLKLFLISLYTLYYILHTPAVSAQTPVSQSTSVSATVINYNLQITGIAAPYASIVLATGGAFLQSTVADQNGSFSLSNVSIGSGVSSVCFTVIDVKRLGESVTCIPIPPVQNNTALNNIFLPPTLGLYRSQIVEGATAILFGYSMPSAKVNVSLNNGLIHSASTDSTGYYEIKVPGVKAGVYQLVSTAVLGARASLVPTKKVTLTAVSAAQQIKQTAKNIVNKLEGVGKEKELGLSIWWWIVFLALILLFLFIFFLWKRRRKKKEETVSKDHLMMSNPPIKSADASDQKFVREDQTPH